MIVVVMVEQLMNYGGESVIMMLIVMGKNGEASIMKVDLAEIEQIVEKLERGEEVGSFFLSRNVYLCQSPIKC